MDYHIHETEVSQKIAHMYDSFHIKEKQTKLIYTEEIRIVLTIANYIRKGTQRKF